ncbi:hypothetical protein [Cohnella zeiphila]|uniref:Spore coat protein B n=1 Tax=Cohnella zeiphila TaxID=2761120 RepID=A0A7X0VX58_9BACL|nr:hypothetical protein [Cohnella zeiphila]MBB6733671.1 hypothetical protein [Cohnella zeiphila]
MFYDYPRANVPQQSQSGSRATQSRLVQRAADLIGYHVKINRGGPDMVEGTLLAIPSDYLVLNTKDGTIYVNSAHVKSMTEVSKSASTGNRSTARSFLSASSFHSLLSRLRHQFIQINRGGPEKIDGFLADVNTDSLLVVMNREVVRIPVYHIKTVNASGKNKNQKNKNQSGGSQSGGQKSGGQKSGGQKSGNQKSGKKNNRSGGWSQHGNHSGKSR